jgi:hypothetical protein
MSKDSRQTLAGDKEVKCIYFLLKKVPRDGGFCCSQKAKTKEPFFVLCFDHFFTNKYENNKKK